MPTKEPSRISRGTLISSLIAAGTLVYAITSHSTDNSTALDGRVSAVETAVKAGKDDAIQDRRETQRRLDTIDQRTIDIYRVLLDMQQHQEHK